MLRAIWYEGTAQLLSLTEFKSHLFELYFVGWIIKPMKEGRKPEYPEKTPGDELQKMPHTTSTMYEACTTMVTYLTMERKKRLPPKPLTSSHPFHPLSPPSLPLPPLPPTPSLPDSPASFISYPSSCTVRELSTYRPGISCPLVGYVHDLSYWLIQEFDFVREAGVDLGDGWNLGILWRVLKYQGFQSDEEGDIFQRDWLLSLV